MFTMIYGLKTVIWCILNWNRCERLCPGCCAFRLMLTCVSATCVCVLCSASAQKRPAGLDEEEIAHVVSQSS
jgi:hypothetical protein